MAWQNHLSEDLLSRYDVRNYRHAAEILATAYPEHLKEITDALLRFNLTKQDILNPGGNESGITQRFRDLLRPQGWIETRISADLVVRRATGRAAETSEPSGPVELTREGYIDGHKIDFVKGPVALDWEWNSKDQTFDRDLFAFRTFFECGVIGAGVLVTRSAALNPVFKKLGVSAKYGASTTWMDKLTYRLEAGRHGGCPILVLGITPAQISDLDLSQ